MEKRCIHPLENGPPGPCRQVFRTLLLLAAAALLFPWPVFAGGRMLRLLFTHDLHSYLAPHYEKNSSGQVERVGGVARIAYVAREARRRWGESVLLLDAGDFSEGTLFHTVFSDAAPELRMMGAVGYDATTFGNHEFGFFPSGLAAMLETARARAGRRLPLLVASNIRFSSGEARDASLRRACRDYPVRDYAVLVRNGIRIGIFGLLGRDASDDMPYADPVRFEDPAVAARRVVRQLREREHVALVICLSHSGTSPVLARSEDEQLAARVPGIDLIVSGHSHTVLQSPTRVGKTLIVSAGPYGTRLGEVDLQVGSDGVVSLVGYRLRMMDARVPEDPDVARQVAGFRAIVERRYLSRFGYRFGQVLAVMPFDAPTLDELYTHPGESGIGNLVTDAYRYAVKRAEGASYRRVDAAVDVLGCIRSPLFRGPVTTEDVFQTASLGPVRYGFCGNTLVAPYVTGRDLKNLLEVETSIAPMKRDGQLSVSGIRFRYNPERLFFDRVTSIAVQEDDGTFRQVEPGRLYRIVVNSYLAHLVDLIRTRSFGLVRVTFRDASGRAVADPDRFTVRDAKGPVREWVALAGYLGSFPRVHGLPQVPERYRHAEGRIVAVPSRNPVDLVAGGNWMTWGLIVAFSVCCLLFMLVLWRLFRRLGGG